MEGLHICAQPSCCAMTQPQQSPYLCVFFSLLSLQYKRVFKKNEIKTVTCLAKTAISSLKESEEQTSPPATPGSLGVHVANSHFSNTSASSGNKGWLQEGGNTAWVQAATTGSTMSHCKKCPWPKARSWRHITHKIFTSLHSDWKNMKHIAVILLSPPFPTLFFKTSGSLLFLKKINLTTGNKQTDILESVTLQRRSCFEFRPWERVWNILLLASWYWSVLCCFFFSFRTHIDLLRLTFLAVQSENIWGGDNK